MSNSSSGIAQLQNIPLVGINLGSVANAGQILPGSAGTHYQWPNQDTITHWVKDLGVRLIRFPFELQRAIQLSTVDGLPGQGASLNQEFVDQWKIMLKRISDASNGEARIIPDPHHYMRLHRYQTDANGQLTGNLYPREQAGNQDGWKVTEQVLIQDGNSVNGGSWSAVHLANFHQKLVVACDDLWCCGARQRTLREQQRWRERQHYSACYGNALHQHDEHRTEGAAQQLQKTSLYLRSAIRERQELGE